MPAAKRLYPNSESLLSQSCREFLPGSPCSHGITAHPGFIKCVRESHLGAVSYVWTTPCCIFLS
ncbi:Urease accessory protein UreD [Clarias magur]|uniref:Urease accessory protein UreD n=1 Tax=Clarias magur TaxID=1594786 RepID=A0A8J4UCB1_CLAMG|nr:Urease accessory protein UreD [Clarias magur]